MGTSDTGLPHPLDRAYGSSSHTKDCLDFVVYRMYLNYLTDVSYSNADTVTAAGDLLKVDAEWCLGEENCR